MKKLNRKHLVGALLASALVGATAMTGAQARGPGGDGFVDRMAGRLELSEAQIAEVRAVIDEHRAERRALGDRIRQSSADVRELTRSEMLDVDALRAAADEQAQAMSDRIVLRATVRSQIRAVLDPSQREMLDAMEDERRGRGRHGGKWRR